MPLLILRVGIAEPPATYRTVHRRLTSTPITIAGQTATDDHPLRANYNFVSPEHFETLGIRIVRGRGFTSNGRTQSVTIFDLKTLKKISETTVGEGPDAILFDPATKRGVVDALLGLSSRAGG